MADATAAWPAWQGRPRRVVCLRQALAERPDARGRRLVECPGYTYRVFVTTVPYAADLVTRMYAGRADRENRIKELKEDLSLDTFCLQAFDATDADPGALRRPPSRAAGVSAAPAHLSEGLPIAVQLEWDLTEAEDGGSPQSGDPDSTLPAVCPSPHGTGSSP